MEMILILLQEFEQEAKTTRKFLERVPADKFTWRPHEKSMDLRNLSVHLAELPAWVQMGLTTEGLDFETTPYKPSPADTTEDLLRIFESAYQEGERALHEAKDSDLSGKWILRNGDTVLADMTKYGIIRHALNQTTHHRAQLGVYLRLLDIPIPGSYGPSADDPQF